MTTKGEFALLWANGKTFSEIYDLMEAQIRREAEITEKLESSAIATSPQIEALKARLAHEFVPGDGAYYDDEKVTVVERVPSTRAGSDDYLVEFENGGQRTVWGSDLVRVT